MEGQVQIPSGNVDTSFCLDMAFHIFLKEADGASNFVFSPFSFHCMLSLIAVGSRGSTLEQLLSFLKLKSLDELKSLASQAITSVLLPSNWSEDQTGSPIVSFVNGAWVDLSYRLKPSFQEVVKGVYCATAKEVDFVNEANQVLNDINSWVETETRGIIKNLLPSKCLGDDTALVLANALYFKGTWDRKFDASKTKYNDFHLLGGQIVQVPFMTSKRYQRHLYGCFDGYKILQIPYQNDQDTRQFSMYFFLPEVTDGLHSLIQVFKSSPELYTMQFKLREEDLPEFWIPRFKFSFKFEASKSMKELGLELPFKAVGELSEMVDSAKSLFLSNVFHASCIEVNEEGTEAAASTAPRLIRQSRRLNPPSFVADHPFLFLIREEKSGMTFFIGAVINPLLVS
ncbi:PREDICTED: serpin-ZX-like [Populus euphratica]|uniref:Serpin-ZX-like n=1 Tax=Populus euphratica TaxID=75702 RepID=A0AAJ6XJL6_POPEU|nr:PREDICTED: serpin-ZX-like [Populus euphratica]